MSGEVSMADLERIIRRVVREELERDDRRLMRELANIIIEGGRVTRKSEGEKQVIVARGK